MSNTVIKVENISKCYRIGEMGGYKTLRDILGGVLAMPFNHNGKQGSSKNKSIWALKDVSFEIQQGETVGIMGRNGSGKSTLLKILSRITNPTKGQAVICGSIGALLEAGVGFNSELTGKENVYLNGTILGMGKKEIRKKYDDIVEFANIGGFLDTPIKHYSSGMKMRLAFSIATHVKPDILLIDEVLAVGDAEFQKKCLQKLHDITQEGRTVLFVSHNLSAVKSLCSRAIVLENGQVIEDGNATNIVSKMEGNKNENRR
jgi:lipopolysaccharide transport system ATP-binding protein